MKHRIVIRCEAHSLSDFALKQQIAKCITAALDKQGVDTPCEINVLVTDDEGIRAINKAYRQIDKATDVLSFPMFELTPGKLPASWESYQGSGYRPCAARRHGHQPRAGQAAGG